MKSQWFITEQGEQFAKDLGCDGVAWKLFQIVLLTKTFFIEGRSLCEARASIESVVKSAMPCQTATRIVDNLWAALVPWQHHYKNDCDPISGIIARVIPTLLFWFGAHSQSIAIDTLLKSDSYLAHHRDGPSHSLFLELYEALVILRDEDSWEEFSKANGRKIGKEEIDEFTRKYMDERLAMCKPA